MLQLEYQISTFWQECLLTSHDVSPLKSACYKLTGRPKVDKGINVRPTNPGQKGGARGSKEAQAQFSKLELDSGLKKGS